VDDSEIFVRCYIAVRFTGRWLSLVLMQVFIVKQARRSIAAGGERLPPRRRHVESAGSPELIDGNQARALPVKFCDDFKDGI
jgi:hypothetical protein